MKTFTEAYDQLIKYENLQPALEKLIEKARVTLIILGFAESLGLSQSDKSLYDKKFWDLIDSILKLSDYPGSTPNQQGDSRIHCAFMIFMMGNFLKTEKLLKEVILKYLGVSNLHNAVVASWMRGCVLWQTQEGRDDAIQEWSRSIEYVNRILRDGRHSLSLKEVNEYRKHLDEMREALEEKIEGNF